MSFFNIRDISYEARKKNITRESAKRTLNEFALFEKFAVDNVYDIFLSHSYLDAEQILIIKYYLEDMGFLVYVDWIDDKQLSRTEVNKHTALQLKRRMGKSKSLFYITTESHVHSKWMPWELGYFDGLKNKAAILPVLESPDSSYNGTEYLSIYPYIDRGSRKDILWVNDGEGKRIEFTRWLNGEEL